MTHNPIQTMLDEHEVICQTEVIIESLDGVWNTDVDRYESTVTTLVEFFREYADGYHHRKEEDVLFPEIKNHPDFVLQEIIEEFEQHHEDFRDYTGEIEEAIREKNYEKSYLELNKYLQDLLDHIGAENDELFVLAETLMDEDDLETIYFKFKDIDRELGEDRKVMLEKTISALLE
ncbi:MAG: hemerythrin domain-containing protein [Crocinitomicaceae bacterium]|nr:hemerythrin domain-containing protein [Crocinitomicaceae bacterium]